MHNSFRPAENNLLLYPGDMLWVFDKDLDGICLQLSTACIHLLEQLTQAGHG
jgi:hypothetical protein